MTEQPYGYGEYGEYGERERREHGEYWEPGQQYGGQGQGQGQTYEGYQGGYDAGYGEQGAFPQAAQPYPQQHQPHQPQQGWFDGDVADPQQHTQQWQGQTWETSVQPSLTVPTAAETAYMPTTGAAPYQQPAAAQAPAPAPPVPTVEGNGGAAEGNGAGAGYGAATVTGNARITDAQRARLEGRSPIIEPGMQPALLTAVLGALLAGAAAVGSYALVLPLVVLQAVTAAGWFRLNGMWPARQGIALAFLGGLVADVAVLAAGREHGPAAILGTLGVWVLLTVVLQLRSHADADERMYGLMATVVSAALTIVATGHLAADTDAVAVGGVAVAVAIVARALPLPTAVSVVVALLAAAGAGIAVGGMTDLGSAGAVLGAGAGVCALIGHRAASYDYPSRFVHFTAGVSLPLAAAAPAVWVLGQALG
ncbi:hypothetical protein QFZ63_004327 [Streptomyces sp. B3I7]|uniref:hypothetical protein n=1 Tax=Streptomyces sp. B3I7 TaxID=3042269 RepID=UPI00278AB741|nr:hypothetical protein [Streptomyces sp. B3I7]MDQ0812613.1 hypothetical protein [Streptomyces sp. B3I7]